MKHPDGSAIAYRFIPINTGGEHFTVEIEGEAVGTFQWVRTLTSAGPSRVARVFHRSGGMPALVPNERAAIEWLLKIEEEQP